MNRRSKRLSGLQKLESREMKTAEMGLDLQASLDMVERPTDVAAIGDAACRGALVFAVSQRGGGGKSVGIHEALDRAAPETRGVVVRIENPDGSVDWTYSFSADQPATSTSALSASNVDATFAQINRGGGVLSFLDTMVENECGL